MASMKIEAMVAESSHQTLGYMLLAYMTLMVAVVTLIPFDFCAPKNLHFIWHGNTADVIRNVFLFIPLGFFYQTTHGQVCFKSLFGALCFGLLISGIVEIGQLFLPSRYSSGLDIITNGMGSWLGALLAGFYQRMVRQGRMPELFGFGLPLISSAYLLIPLLWLSGIATGTEKSRLGLMILLGVHGGGVISSAVVNRYRHAMRRQRFAVFVNTTCWFMIGAVPVLFHFPLAMLAMALIVGFVAQLSGLFWEKRSLTERRFELPTLKWLLPIYLFYLLLVSVWPTTLPLGEWSLHGVYRSLNQTEQVFFVSRFVEVIAGFTLLGYLLAEMYGRRKETGLRALTRVFFFATAIAMGITALRNVHAEPVYVPMEAAIFTIAAMYGAVVYRLQLMVVRQPSKSPMR